MTEPLRPNHDALHAQDEILAERADRLAATVAALRAAVTSLDERASHVEERTTEAENEATRAARANRRAVVAIAIVALFTLVGGWLIWSNYRTVSRLDAVVAQVKQQQAQSVSLRQDTLCPILRASLAADSPQARASFPAGTAAHDVFVAKIRRGVDAMHCAQLNGGP